MSTVAETKDWMLSIPLDAKYRAAVQAAAAQELDKMAGYGRRLVLHDLRRRGLLDDRFEPIEQDENTSE